jgi:hypothetical protein
MRGWASRPARRPDIKQSIPAAGPPPKADAHAAGEEVAFGPKHKVAALQPAARGPEPQGL